MNLSHDPESWSEPVYFNAIALTFWYITELIIEISKAIQVFSKSCDFLHHFNNCGIQFYKTAWKYTVAMLRSEQMKTTGSISNRTICRNDMHLKNSNLRMMEYITMYAGTLRQANGLVFSIITMYIKTITFLLEKNSERLYGLALPAKYVRLKWQINFLGKNFATNVSEHFSQVAHFTNTIYCQKGLLHFKNTNNGCLKLMLLSRRNCSSL